MKTIPIANKILMILLVFVIGYSFSIPSDLVWAKVQSTDRYSLTYIPGMGTELSLNGKSLGVIEGHDFSEAVFSIWLGKNPIDESFRDQLLGMVP